MLILQVTTVLICSHVVDVVVFHILAHYLTFYPLYLICLLLSFCTDTHDERMEV